jgi:hypothetical protein
MGEREHGKYTDKKNKANKGLLLTSKQYLCSSQKLHTISAKLFIIQDLRFLQRSGAEEESI